MSKARFFKAYLIKKSRLKSFNNGFAYNRVGSQRFWRIVSGQYTHFFSNLLLERPNFEGQWKVAISETSYPSMYQNITEGKFKFFDEKLSKSTSTYNLEPGLYTSITDIVEAMNRLIQERNNHNETCITVKVSQRTQKVVNLLAKDTSGLAFCSTDLGHIFGNNVGN